MENWPVYLGKQNEPFTASTKAQGIIVQEHHISSVAHAYGFKLEQGCVTIYNNRSNSTKELYIDELESIISSQDILKLHWFVAMGTQPQLSGQPISAQIKAGNDDIEDEYVTPLTKCHFCGQGMQIVRYKAAEAQYHTLSEEENPITVRNVPKRCKSCGCFHW